MSREQDPSMHAWLIVLAVVVAALFVMLISAGSPAQHAAAVAARAAEEKARHTPHLVGKAGACDVYESRNSADNLVTIVSCPDKTTASTERRVYCGKSCWRTETDEAVTVPGSKP